MSIFDLEFRIEKKFRVILRVLRELNKMVLFIRREEQSKRMWDISLRLSVKCKMQNGASFKSSLYSWAGRSV